MSDQMAPVLQSMQDYVEHHYLDEMMDEIEAVIDMEHKQHLNLGFRRKAQGLFSKNAEQLF